MPASTITDSLAKFLAEVSGQWIELQFGINGITPNNAAYSSGKELRERRLRRFLVGPKALEITGIAETPDGKTLFINIQHPGETTVPDFATGAFGSHWSGSGLTRPRSATIAITRDDELDLAAVCRASSHCVA